MSDRAYGIAEVVGTSKESIEAAIRNAVSRAGAIHLHVDWFEVSQMDQSLFFVVDKMKIGELSDPVPVRIGEKKESYRIVSLKARTEPHRANLKQDYQRILLAAENEKKEKLVRDWIERKRLSFFIKIDPEFSDCPFKNSWNSN